METLLPTLRAADPDAPAPVDLDALFARTGAERRLEIGFGGGEHLAGDARNNPDIDFIGCEPYVDGVASLLAEVEEGGLANVRVFDDDARLLLPVLPDARFSRIYVLFPDPWPKRRHRRRRILQAETLTDFARIAADGCELVFASDHMGYAAWTLAEVRRHPDWRWTARRPADWRRPPADWVATRYEAQALAKGDRPAYLTFRRKARKSP